MSRIAAVLVVMLAGILPAAAQTVDPFPQLRERIHPGDRVLVTMFSGATLSGRVTSLTSDEIAIDTPPSAVRLAAVREVKVRRRSVRRGAIVGAAAGALAVGIPECNGDPRDQCGDGIAMGALVGAGFGAVAGAFIPHMAVAFRAPDATVAVVPLLQRRAIGLAAGIRW